MAELVKLKLNLMESGMDKVCERCRAAESDFVMLAYRGTSLVCQECDAAMEREWVEEDPQNNRHYLDSLNDNWRPTA